MSLTIWSQHQVGRRENSLQMIFTLCELRMKNTRFALLFLDSWYSSTNQWENWCLQCGLLFTNLQYNVCDVQHNYKEETNTSVGTMQVHIALRSLIMHIPSTHQLHQFYQWRSGCNFYIYTTRRRICTFREGWWIKSFTHYTMSKKIRIEWSSNF